MNVVSKDIRKMTSELFDNCGTFGLIDLNDCKNKTFQVEDRAIWDVEENRVLALKRAEYFGIRFTYSDGEVQFVTMDLQEYSRKSEIKETAHKRYYIQKNIEVKNKKMDAFIEELNENGDYKEVNISFPYLTESDETFVFMFPKDIPQKNHANYECNDVLIYDTYFQTYHKVKTLSHGFSELFNNGVWCRSGMADGGYVTRLRETCFIDIDETMVYLISKDKNIKPKFTEDELEEALQVVYGLTLKH